ncbi:hypothetical protein [Alloactinosynnema sp. L-07]|uniref:hypothetical protein n=1 Tax=Alloactinosynnema sp. L-07 TaxID=1653480 RepID=UPI0012FCBD88|nr:hypothetical protein [Alloactinosynnema sp. L-07]
MAIDPAHLPILGDPRPTPAPTPVRVACGLFVTQVALSVLHLTVSWANTGVDLSLYFVPLALTLWFAVCVTDGRDWARTGAVVVSGLSALLSVGLISGPFDVVVVLPMLTAVGFGAHLVYRADVREFFEQADERV